MAKPVFVFVLVLSLLIICGCGPSEMIEITPPGKTPQPSVENIYIGGDVNVAGIYTPGRDDTLGELLSSAGGMQGGASSTSCYVYFYNQDPVLESQRVDINRAPAWLLEALPGIGEVTAAGIVEYRNSNGPFRHIKDIMHVNGIGEATFEALADKITVGDRPE